jgi:hypothetical protein
MFHLQYKKRKNSRHYSDKDVFQDKESVIKYLADNGIKFSHTPYVFTHICLDNGEIITQEYNGIICSPIELAEALKK